MRYLGNKKNLLADIERAARSVGFTRGVVCDLFAGSGRVGRHFRALGNLVLATDLMACSHVFQKVFLELAGPPGFEGLRTRTDLPPPIEESRIGEAQPADPSAWHETRRALAHLEQLDPIEGFLGPKDCVDEGGTFRTLRTLDIFAPLRVGAV